MKIVVDVVVIMLQPFHSLIHTSSCSETISNWSHQSWSCESDKFRWISCSNKSICSFFCSIASSFSCSTYQETYIYSYLIFRTPLPSKTCKKKLHRIQTISYTLLITNLLSLIVDTTIRFLQVLTCLYFLLECLKEARYNLAVGYLSVGQQENAINELLEILKRVRHTTQHNPTNTHNFSTNSKFF